MDVYLRAFNEHIRSIFDTAFLLYLKKNVAETTEMIGEDAMACKN
jgi:hypothetical protein